MAKKRISKSRRKKKIRYTLLKYVLIFVLLAGIAAGLFVYSVYAGLWGKLPTYAELRDIRNDEASVLYSEDGELIGKYYIENRTNVKYEGITQNALDALIATEDVRFYEHQGVDKISMLRVFFKTFLLRHRSSGGGSTISQQLAKNL